MLPATQQMNAPILTPTTHAGTQFTYPGEMEGWVDISSCVYYYVYIQQ